ncbi:protein of unknown function [Malonomonas rubra DSM 5091]|uniref:Flavinylation-associated cytochrome domain-containing protein n=1 Tax=Malonomonas rubra DSM 5091 TaxID=1122189 RepID=A0A1M6E2G4_MALRU|nr:DUF4405 domain-containing protein [Malonomonas rubra]SHI79734.1 protein of unknown function [Malonomonas rubra DSM 5091]
MFWEKNFSFRGFISLLITFSSLIMIVSGIIAYIMPEGRIAYWADWRFWGLGKEQWGTIHTVFSFVFILATVFHLIYNWKPLINYLKDKVKKTYSMRGELVLVLLISIIFTHGSISGVIPFSSIMDLGSEIGKSWYEGQEVHPPFPHAELMTMKQLTSRMDLRLDGALDYLREQGFTEVTEKSTLKDLAARSTSSPMQIFDAMMMDDRVY